MNTAGRKQIRNDGFAHIDNTEKMDNITNSFVLLNPDWNLL